MGGTNRWLKISLLNLVLVALLGTLMRYKIGFSFPYLDQKSLQFSHSYFAFYGWISQTLMVLMVHVLRKYSPFSFKSYNWVFLSSLTASYGLLVSYAFLGFGVVSSVFSAALILVSYVFLILFLRDMRNSSLPRGIAVWFRAALFFSALSTIGSVALAWLMLSGGMLQNTYLALQYYFLHFQYNGWFFFACMGLFLEFTGSVNKAHRTAFWLYFAACIPAYLLSILWVNFPSWLVVIIGIFALLQVAAWLIQLRSLMSEKPLALVSQPPVLRFVLYFVGAALTIKLMLQLGSTIPALSKLAFGFRSVVIAYLHLALLAVLTLYILFHVFANDFFRFSRGVRISLAAFMTGVFLNELVLGIQGIAGFSYTPVPYGNEILFGVSALLFVSAFGMWAGSSEKIKEI